MEINLEFSLHTTQRQVFDDKTRYKIIAAGRRYGKTRGALTSMVRKGIKATSDHLGWWVSPMYSQSKTAFKYLKKLYSDIIKYKNETDLRVELLNGSILEFKSSDNPDSLRSEGLNDLVMDECAMIKAEAWQEVLRPAIIDRKGDVCFISTPKGMNWFYEVFQKGLVKGETEFKSFQYTTYDNPFIDKVEIEKAKAEMPERLFNQEILAQFIEDIGGVFRNVRECIDGDYEEPLKEESYVMGVDLGKYQDFTVIIVMKRSNKHVVAFDRFNQINWSLQEQRILDYANKYKPEILIDQGQVGDAVLEALQEKYPNIEGVKFTNENKTAMINYLSNAIEKKQITYPDIPEMINELRIYEYEALPSGKLRMNAPSGRHDDTVIALALALWQVRGADIITDTFALNDIDYNQTSRLEGIY